MTENLNEQIETTAKLLAQLEAERADLSNKMKIAANDADSAAMITLKHRATNLPVEIFAAQIRLKRLLLQRDEERLPKLQAEVGKFSEPIQAAIAKRDEAVRELNILQGNYHAVNEDLKELNRNIGAKKREIDELVHSAKPSTGLRKTAQMHFGN